MYLEGGGGGGGHCKTMVHRKPGGGALIFLSIRRHNLFLFLLFILSKFPNSHSLE